MHKIYELALALELIANDDPSDTSNEKHKHIHGQLLNDPLVRP